MSVYFLYNFLNGIDDIWIAPHVVNYQGRLSLKCPFSEPLYTGGEVQWKEIYHDFFIDRF